MSKHTEKEVQKAKDILNKENPTEEDVEKVNSFFGEQVRVSDEKYESLKDHLKTYVEEVNEYGGVKSGNETIEVENGTITLKTHENESFIHIVIHDENEDGGFALIENVINDLMMKELNHDPPSPTHTDNKQRKYMIYLTNG